MALPPVSDSRTSGNRTRMARRQTQCKRLTGKGKRQVRLIRQRTLSEERVRRARKWEISRDLTSLELPPCSSLALNIIRTCYENASGQLGANGRCMDRHDLGPGVQATGVRPTVAALYTLTFSKSGCCIVALWWRSHCLCSQD